MASFFKDNEDLQFYFEQGIDWAPVAAAAELDYRLPDGHRNLDEALAFYRDALTMVGELVAEEIAPHAAEIDRQGVRFDHGEVVVPPELERIFAQLRELDLHGLCLPRELGGSNAPLLIYHLASEMFARADISVMAHFGFHGGMAVAMLILSILEGSTSFDGAAMKLVTTRFVKEIDEITRGEAWGSMDITEPDAGSDMAALRTVGEEDAAGNWTLTGQKIFITSGHGKYHFVIARTEQPAETSDPLAGLAALSLFLVRAYDDAPDGTRTWHTRFERIEEKLGHHGSVTACQTFESTPAELIGKRGDGFRQMLLLMNNARLSVGFEAIGLCEAAYRLAKTYAETRPSMGKTIDRHEMIADTLDEMRTDIQGLRALAVHGAWHQELAERARMHLSYLPDLDEAERARLAKTAQTHRAQARRVTPLLKYLAAEKAVEMARRSLQIHGGNGYTTDYGAEKLLRDAMVLPIYEGTSQIQCLMATKDTLTGALRNFPKFLKRRLRARWRALSASHPLERRVARLQSLSLSVQQHLMTRMATRKLASLRGQPLGHRARAFLHTWDPKRDFAYALLHAERLTRLLAEEAICECLLTQARAHSERRELLERYLERAEPRCRYLADAITSTGPRLLARLAESEERPGAAVG